MASFVVQEWQPTEDVDCTDNSQKILWLEMKNSLLFTMDWSDWLLVLVSCSSQEVMPLQCNDAD
jgi:hypothetical protein